MAKKKKSPKKKKNRIYRNIGHGLVYIGHGPLKGNIAIYDGDTDSDAVVFLGPPHASPMHTLPSSCLEPVENADPIELERFIAKLDGFETEYGDQMQTMICIDGKPVYADPELEHVAEYMISTGHDDDDDEDQLIPVSSRTMRIKSVIQKILR